VPQGLRRSSGDLGGPWWNSSFFGLHAGSDAINAQFTNSAEQAGIANRVLSDIVALPSLSHFNQYFIAQALARIGALDRGVEAVRIQWGADVKLGATTFFEVGHPYLADILEPGPPPLPAEQNGWTLLCADWSTGATQWLTQYVLGIRPITPGYQQVKIAPHIVPTVPCNNSEHLPACAPFLAVWCLPFDSRAQHEFPADRLSARRNRRIQCQAWQGGWVSHKVAS
jgi:alpha-L-rhamnosidase